MIEEEKEKKKEEEKEEKKEEEKEWEKETSWCTSATGSPPFCYTCHCPVF